MHTTFMMLPAVVETLDRMSKTKNLVDSSTATAAYSLCKAVTSFSFIVGLTISYLTLDVTKSLCLKLQGQFHFPFVDISARATAAV